MTTQVERRYRRALRMLPPSYRAEREEEMVEAFLDGAGDGELDDMRPSWGELASVAALAVRTRLGASGAPPRYAVAGAVVRLFALLSVLLYAAQELTDRALSLASLHGAPAQSRQEFLSIFSGHGVLDGAWETARWLLPLCWVGAYAALLRDRRRTATVLAVLAALPQLGFLMEVAVEGMGVSLDGVLPSLTQWLTVLAVGWGFHRDAPAAALPRPLLPPGQTLLATCVLLGAATVAYPGGADEVWAVGTVFVLAAGLWFGARMRGARAAEGPVLPLALAVLGAALVVLRCGTLTFLATASTRPAGLLVTAAVQTLVIAALTAGLAVCGARRLPTKPGTAAVPAE